MVEASNMKNCIVFWFQISDLKSEGLGLNCAFVSWLTTALRVKDSAVEDECIFIRCAVRALPKIEDFGCRFILNRKMMKNVFITL